MERRKIKNKEQTFEVSQDDLQGYYSRYLPHYGAGGPLPATNPWFKIANLGNKLSNFKNVSNKDIKAKDYMKFSLTNTAKAGDLSGDETEFLMNDDGTVQVDEKGKKIPNPLYDTGNRYLSVDEKNNPELLTYGQNKANLLNPYIGSNSERVKSGMFSERRVNPVTGRVEYINADGSRTSGDIAEDHLVNYNAESFNFDKDKNVVSWNTTKYNDYNEPTEFITNPYDVNNPFNIKEPHSEQSKINDDFNKKDEIDVNENIHPKSQKQINEEYLKNINKDIDDKTKKYGGQLPKAQNSEEVVFENWSDQFEKADLQGALDAQAESYGIADAKDIDPTTGMPSMGSLSAYGEVWGTENYADGSWDDVEGVTPTTEDLDPEGGWANTRIGSIDDQGVMSSYDAEVPFADRSKYSSIPGQNQNEAGEWVDGEPVLKQYDDDGFQIYNTLDKDQMKTAQKSLKVKNKADKKALKLANKETRIKKRKMWGDTLSQQATNFGNYALDKLGNSKGAALADITVDAAGIFTDFKKAQNASIMNQKPIQGMNTIDNLIDPLTANAEGTRGNYDTNTGLLRIDDAVVSELARYGKELYQVGGEPESLTSLRRFTEEMPIKIGYNEEDILNQKLSLAQMRQGGQLPKFQDKNSEVLDLENETRKERKNRIKNYTHPYLQEYYDEFEKKGDISSEKEVRNILSSMNVMEGDTAFVNQSMNRNMVRTMNNMDVNQYIGSQMYDDGSGNWSGSIGYDDKQNYFTTKQDEDGLSWDFMRNLYNNSEGNYTGVLKSRKKYGGEQVDIDEQLLQELIAAGADIEIL